MEEYIVINNTYIHFSEGSNIKKEFLQFIFNIIGVHGGYRNTYFFL